MNQSFLSAKLIAQSVLPTRISPLSYASGPHSPSLAPISQPYQAVFLGRSSLVIPWSNSMKALAVHTPHLSTLCQSNIKVGSQSLHNPYSPNLPPY